MKKQVPKFIENVFKPKMAKYCLCIPVINEGERIINQLKNINKLGIDKIVDIIICDGGSSDGSCDPKILSSLGVNALLTKNDSGKLSAQLRMGYFWSLQRGYEGIITVDGNGKDSIESVLLFIKKLDDGYDFIQGSRFIDDGKAINTPFLRYIGLKLLHAPIISIAAKFKFTDTTNGFRGYSKKYLNHKNVQPFRNIFDSYELLSYLSVRASQLGLKVCEVPVTRSYPQNGKIPTKISFLKGNYNLLKILIKTWRGEYNPNDKN